MSAVYPEQVSRRCRSLKFCRQQRIANAEAIAASIECGTFVRFRISVDTSNSLIGSIAFTSNGCGFMLAAADVVAEYLQDRHLSQLHGLDPDELSSIVGAELSSIPFERLQCVLTVVEAVRESFASYRRSRVEEFRGERALICTCFGISEDTIETVMSERPGATVEDISRLTNAGTGCGSCRFLIEDMLHCQNRER